MSFLFPLWLLLLLPWAALTVFLLRGRREGTSVPFLPLWQGGGEPPRTKRWFSPPPLALMAALLAVLLAIFASARPGLNTGRVGGGAVTVILDRGNTMSAGDRRAEVLAIAREAMADGLGEVTEIVAVPHAEIAAANWFDAASALPATDADTGDAVRLAVRRALAEPDATVVVLSDRNVPDDPRVIQIAPADPLQNAGITRLVVRGSPHAQAMVTVRNDSKLSSGQLSVRSGERESSMEVRLPAKGEEQNYFVDLPHGSVSVTAVLRVNDDIPSDNVAHAAPQRGWPAVEVHSAPAEVQRIAEAYARSRPPGDGSKRLAIVASSEATPPDLPVAIVSTSTSPRAGGEMTVRKHPISAGADWQAMRPRAMGQPPGADWSPIISAGQVPIVAVRQTPQRQVWVGMELGELARTPEFVVLWTNIFDWLGDVEGSAAASIPPNPPSVRIETPVVTDWRGRLAQIKRRRQIKVDVTSPVLLGSVGCLALSALAWSGRRLTAFSAPRTV